MPLYRSAVEQSVAFFQFWILRLVPKKFHDSVNMLATRLSNTMDGNVLLNM